MKKDLLAPSVIARICSHMNKDHTEDLLGIARYYGGVPNPKQAKLINLTSLGMQMEVDNKTIKINFDHELIDSADAHQTLVTMVKEISRHSQ